MDLEPLKIERKPSKAGKKRGGFPFGKLILLVILIGCGWLFRKPLIGFYDGLTLAVVEVAKVVRRNPSTGGAVRGVASNGYVVARTRAALSADTPGRITELLVEEGSLVNEDDLVARLYDAEYRAAVQRATADLELSRAAHRKALAEDAAAASEVVRLESVVDVSIANLDEVKAQVLLAEQNFVRFEKLVSEGVERRQLLDEARENVDAKRARVISVEAALAAARSAVTQGERRKEIAAAAVEEAAAKVEVMNATRDERIATLDKTEVRAPFTGIVVLKDAEVGEVVSPNSQGGSSRGSVVTMVDFQSLEVQADVPETSLSAVNIGGSVKIFLDAFPDDPYEGRVERIWPTADKKKATVEVRVSFAQLDERLRPEMGVRVVFLDEAQAQPVESESEGLVLLQIPSDAVVRVGGKRVVFVVEREAVELREVVVGEARSGRVSVETGLVVGEQVVLSPPADLADGDRVRVGKAK